VLGRHELEGHGSGTGRIGDGMGIDADISAGVDGKAKDLPEALAVVRVAERTRLVRGSCRFQYTDKRVDIGQRPDTDGGKAPVFDIKSLAYDASTEVQAYSSF